MPIAPVDLVVLHEHPEWQKPLFEALRRRGVSFAPFDLTRAAFGNEETPAGRVYFNQASPSAYLRGNTRAVPLALAYMRSLTLRGARVLNGAEVFALELSKSTQATLLRTLGIDTPYSITFNAVGALERFAGALRWPALLKPDQGGSGARIHVVESLADVEAIFARDPSIWLPDNLFLLQEYLAHDPDRGIVRLEFVGGELLYAMRVTTHGRFNLCPSPVCNPEDGESACALPDEPAVAAPPVEFAPFPEVPADAVEIATRIVRTAKLDVGGIEYLETVDGRRVFYDINANSNLRPSVAAAFGFDPFERVVDYLVGEVGGGGGVASRATCNGATVQRAVLRAGCYVLRAVLRATCYVLRAPPHSAASCGLGRHSTTIFPTCCTCAAPVRSQIASAVACRTSRSLPLILTLINSCAVSARSSSSATGSVSPPCPTCTIGSSAWARALRWARSRAVKVGIV